MGNNAPHMTKVCLCLAPISANSAAYTILVVDTLGYRHARFIFNFGVVGSAPTVLKLTSAEPTTAPTIGTDTTLTGAADLTGAVYGTGTAPALSTVVAASIHVIDVDLKGKNRYFLPAVTAGTTTLCAITCQLFHPEIMPDTTAEKGLTQYTYV